MFASHWSLLIFFASRVNGFKTENKCYLISVISKAFMMPWMLSWGASGLWLWHALRLVFTIKDIDLDQLCHSGYLILKTHPTMISFLKMFSILAFIFWKGNLLAWLETQKEQKVIWKKCSPPGPIPFQFHSLSLCYWFSMYFPDIGYLLEKSIAVSIYSVLSFFLYQRTQIFFFFLYQRNQITTVWINVPQFNQSHNNKHLWLLICSQFEVLWWLFFHISVHMSEGFSSYFSIFWLNS